MSGACEYKSSSKKQEQVNEEQERKKQLDIIRLAAMVTILVFVAWMHLLQPIWIANIVIVTAVMVGGYPLYRESFAALRKGRVNMELSMVVAIVASLILSQYLPAIAIAFFALLSEFIEGLIVEKGRKNIQILRNPKKAIVRKNKEYESAQEEQEIPVSGVKVDDIVIVREGDIIPVDGHIIRGISTVDQSTITGESIPIDKSVGDTVFAGTINLTGQLEVKCDKLSIDTTFANIIHLVEEAEASKAPIQKLSDKFATRLIQFAIGLSILTFIVTQNIASTLSVIVVAGACGLAIGTPIALLAANSKLAKRGIIVKGGLQIENLKHTGTIVFDKTGTLTSGKPVVSEVISFDQRIEPEKVLEYAAIAEQNINHHLAKAIEERAAKEKIGVNSRYNQPTINDNSNSNNESINLVKVGGGVTVTQHGHNISVGNMKFMEEQLAVVDNNNIMGIKHDLLVASATTAFVSLDGKIIGAIFVEDKLRDEAKEAVSQIKSMGIHVVMLTGDNEKIAKRIADKVGIYEYYANLLPQDKVSKIEEIVEKQNKESKKTVIMVGDGINDAPALAKADVGIAMGKTGTNIAVETSDVVLMSEDLTKIPYLLSTSRQALWTVQQNFFGTLFIDGLGFILAFAGILNPLSAAIIHVSSELIFMINSARLLIHNTD